MSLNRELFRHGSVYTFARIANYAVVYAMLPLYAHLIGDDGYGLLELMTTVAAFLGFLFLQGLGGAWFRLRFDESPSSLSTFESSIIWYLVATSAAGLALLHVFGERLAELATPGVPYYPMGFLAAIGAVSMIVPRLYESRLQAEKRPGAFAAYTLLRAALTAGVILLFVAGLSRGARGKLEADALALGVMSVAALVLMRPALRFSTASLRRSLAYALPLLPHSLAVLLNNTIDRLLLNGFLGLGATGVYAMGFQIGYGGCVLAIAFNQAYAPIFIDRIKQAELAEGRGDAGRGADLRRQLANAALLSLAAVACVSVSATAFALEIIALIAPPSFDASWTVVAPVAAGGMAWACYFPFSQSILFSPRAVRWLPVVTIVSAAVNVVGNLVLIPRIGIAGAAWSTLGSNLLMAGLALWVGQAVTPIPYAWGRWAGVLGAACAAFAGLWWLDASLPQLAPRLAAKAAVAIASCAMIVRAAGTGPRALFAGLRRRGAGSI